MKKETAFEEIICRMDKLPTLPGIAMKILEAVKKDESDLTEIADIISSDPPLSAEVLRCINSPFYGITTKITSVFHAVNMLGISTVKNLALSFSLVKNLKSNNLHEFDYKAFWKNSLISAVAAKLLARKALQDLSDDAFFLGLLHNIGILALVRCMPDQYSMVIKEMQTSDCPHHVAEDQILGFNHMMIGEYLVKSWGLPDTFYIPIRYHHDPDKLSPHSSIIELTTKILHLSELYTDLFNLPDVTVNLGIIEHYANVYQFTDRIKVDEIGKQINEQTQQIFPLFEISIEDEREYSELIETARKEIIHLSTEFMNTLLEQKREIERLREHVTRDGLTQLINYQHFHELLQQEIYRAKRYKFPLSLIMADIDHFKSINDKWGHLAGDHAIKTVADLLRRTLRKSDHVARYGGEEFAIILPETPLEGGLRVAERSRESISSMTIDYEATLISLTMSFGVATLLPSEDTTKEGLIKKADDALYRAKAAGKNKCFAYNKV